MRGYKEEYQRLTLAKAPLAFDVDILGLTEMPLPEQGLEDIQISKHFNSNNTTIEDLAVQ